MGEEPSKALNHVGPQGCQRGSSLLRSEKETQNSAVRFGVQTVLFAYGLQTGGFRPQPRVTSQELDVRLRKLGMLAEVGRS